MRVLIVDDEDVIRDLVGQMLRGAGHLTSEATNGDEALAMLPLFQPEVMVLDLLMPVRDGFEVLRALRERSDGPRVIVLSAIANLRESAYARELGAEAVIGKPFDIDQLLHAVERRLVPR